METPAYFVGKDTTWLHWVGTEVDFHAKVTITHIALGRQGIYSNTMVEANYPGFYRAYEALSAIGCDKYFVTHVLKFCILRADCLDLDQFLVQSKLLMKVEATLAIGLRWDEVHRLLLKGCRVPNAAELPDDLAHF